MRKLSSKLAGRQSGFTLIELVIVIVIIGILAAVAIPNFTNLSDDANLALAQGVAGGASSAMANNSTACKGGLTSGACVTGVSSCVNVSLIMDVPSKVTISGTSPSCVATAPSSKTAAFKGFTS